MRFTSTVITYNLYASRFLSGIKVEFPTDAWNNEVLESVGTDEGLDESIAVITIIEFIELDNLIYGLKLNKVFTKG